MSESWLTQGFGGVKGEQERVESMYGPKRFFLKEGQKAKVVFLDDEPACIHEHNPKINGKWDQYFTCIKESNPDNPVCCEILGHDTRRYVGYFTIVDCTQFKDKNGNIHQFEVKLLPCRLQSLKLFQSKKDDKDGRLKGRIYNVNRSDKKQQNIGNDWDYDKDVESWDKLFAVANYKGKKLSELFSSEDSDVIARVKKTFNVSSTEGKITQKLVPFNYLDILRPRKPSDLKAILKGAKIETNSNASSSEKSEGQPSEDSVPF